MDTIIHDTGTIRVLMRPLRDNLADVPLTLKWWERTYQTEPYRFAQGIASAQDGGTGSSSSISYWYGRVGICMQQGLALGLFVGNQVEGEWKYGAASGGLLALPDTNEPTRAELLYCAGNAFAPNSREQLLDAGRVWAKERGRTLAEKRVTVAWVPA